MPGLGYWQCWSELFNAPDELKSTALYLTATSVSTESDEGTHTPQPSLAAATSSYHHSRPSEAADVLTSPKSIALAQATTPLAKTPDSNLGHSEARTAAPETSDRSRSILKLPAPSPSPAIVISHPLTVPVEEVSSTGALNAATQIQSALLPSMLHTSNSQALFAEGSETSETPNEVTYTHNLPTYNVGSHTIAANSKDQYMIENQILTPGSPITLGSGATATEVLLQTAASSAELIIGSSTSIFAAAAIASPLPLTIGSQVITANSDSQYVFESQTLTPGSIITVSNTPISLAASATEVVVGSSTSTLLAATAATATPPPLTFGSQVFTANSDSQYLIGSQTLSPGAMITVSDTPISLAASATEIVVGSSTQGLGSYIMSGFGASPSASTPGVLPFTGAADRVRDSRWWPVAIAVGAIALVKWF